MHQCGMIMLCQESSAKSHDSDTYGETLSMERYEQNWRFCCCCTHPVLWWTENLLMPCAWPLFFAARVGEEWWRREKVLTKTETEGHGRAETEGHGRGETEGHGIGETDGYGGAETEGHGKEQQAPKQRVMGEPELLSTDGRPSTETDGGNVVRPSAADGCHREFVRVAAGTCLWTCCCAIASNFGCFPLVSVGCHSLSGAVCCPNGAVCELGAYGSFLPHARRHVSFTTTCIKMNKLFVHNQSCNQDGGGILCGRTVLVRSLNGERDHQHQQENVFLFNR